RDVMRPVSLVDGRRVAALAYVVDETHEQFVGMLSLEQQVAMVRAGIGIAGPNVDYVLNTARHLQQRGIRDRTLLASARARDAARRRAGAAPGAAAIAACRSQIAASRSMGASSRKAWLAPRSARRKRARLAGSVTRSPAEPTQSTCLPLASR